MGKHIKDVEAAFVRMLANRTLRAQRKAEAEGETYHDIATPTPISSGYGVKLIHVRAPVDGVESEVHVFPKANGSFVLEETAELASEVLAQPAKLKATHNTHLEYVADA